jgi:polyhydroxybutyrate depolymerase
VPVVTVAVVALLAACSPSGGSPAESEAMRSTRSNERASAPSTGCERATVVPPGTTDERIVSGGVEREYRLVVPPAYDGRHPLPLVLGLHALTVDYRIVPSMSGFQDMATSAAFIGVAASGRRDAGVPFWNAAPVADNYDVAFLGDLLDFLQTTLCVDTRRVLSTGMSNGAQMSSLLACRMPRRLAAIAPVAGVEYLEPCDGAPVPIIAFHGSADPILPYTGGGLHATRIAELHYYKGQQPPGLPKPLGIDESMRRWARHNGCAEGYVERHVSPEVRKRTWRDCEAATELYVVIGGGHAWPGKPVPQFERAYGHGTGEIDATALMFDFLDDHPRPS